MSEEREETAGGGCVACLFCGKLASAGDKFCNSCGNYLLAPPVPGRAGAVPARYFRGIPPAFFPSRRAPAVGYLLPQASMPSYPPGGMPHMPQVVDPVPPSPFADQAAGGSQAPIAVPFAAGPRTPPEAPMAGSPQPPPADPVAEGSQAPIAVPFAAGPRTPPEAPMAGSPQPPPADPAAGGLQPPSTPPGAPASGWNRPAPPLYSRAPAPRPPEQERKKAESLAAASVICGIAGFTLLPVIAAAAAVITGVMAMALFRSGPQPAEGEGLAAVGIILGGAGLAAATALLVLLLAL